ncbi:MAG: CopD family protein [Flavobacteriales bacterium]
MNYDVIKSLHIIFIVTWFAGLFYMFRLFVYHVEAAAKPEPEREILLRQLSLMQKRLWFIITWPSAVLTLILGPTLLVLMPDWLRQPWMHLKLFFILGLIIYQIYGHQIYKKLQTNPAAFKSFYLRLMNEVGTLLLVAIVFLVVMKNAVSWIWGSIGLIGTGVLLMILAKMYKTWREKKGQA